MEIRNHLFPLSIKEAIEMLKNKGNRAQLIAGGTDLIPAIRDRSNKCEVLVDMSKIPELDKIELFSSTIQLGPRVTMDQTENSELIRKEATALAEGSSLVGGPQIRNRATIAGNIVSAQPAADAALSLFCLNAQLKIFGVRGERIIKIEEAYLDVGKSTIDPTSEMVISIFFEKQGDEEISVFKRMAKRDALALPVLNCAVWIRKKEDKFSEVKIALGPVAPIPIRVKRAEESLKGEKISLKNIEIAAEIAAEIASPRNSQFRGSGAYRKEMVKVIVVDAFKTALYRLNVEDF